jgi:L-ascorbate metabolism protein UlaG (beta-lactamase superfamily)
MMTAAMHRILALVLFVLGGCATLRPDPRRPVSLTYLGVAGWALSDGHHTILVDPYFSRPADLAHAVSDEGAVAARTPARADLVLVGHAHVDHALDAPWVALKSGASLLGGADLVPKAREAGLPDERILLVKGGEDYAFDGFSVRVLPSLHSVIGVENGGDVQTFAYLVRLGGREILVLGTANYIERELAGIRPDVAIVATGLREKIHDYSCRLMRVLGRPRMVLTTHFDAWRKPVGTPLEEDTRADLRRFTAEIKRCAPATKVIVPEPMVSIPAH